MRSEWISNRTDEHTPILNSLNKYQGTKKKLCLQILFKIFIISNLLVIYYNQSFAKDISRVILIRTLATSWNDYKEELQSTLHRLSPIDAIENQLSQGELSEKTKDLLKEFKRQHVKRKPNIKEILQFLETVNPTLSSVSQGKKVCYILQTEYPFFQCTSQQIPKKISEISSTFSLQSSDDKLTRELLQLWKRMRSQKGAEDLTWFVNGTRWKDSLVLEPQKKYQWLVVSSALSPKTFLGKPDEFIKSIKNATLSPWVEKKNSSETQWTTIQFIRGFDREILHPGRVIEHEGFSSEGIEPTARSNKSFAEKIKENRVWVGVGLLIGIGLFTGVLTGAVALI